MKTIFKFLLYLTLGIILLSLLTNVIIYGGLLYLTYFVVKKTVLFIKHKRAEKKQLQETAAQAYTIEHKMENLLKLSGNYIEAPALRHAYLEKTELNLQDKWYQFLDLRAKLELNNTSTGKAEAVLHVMCDEITARIQMVDVEVTDRVKKEFIEENLTPLLDDLNEILGGIKPTDTIDINAHDLLKNYNLEAIG